MEKEIEVGRIVKHKSGYGPPMVVLSKRDSEHGYLEYECRWYNEKSGSFECQTFYNSELELES